MSLTLTLLETESYQPRLPVDQPAREAALDTSRSLIVQAAAGAGKTELLTTRFLALLAEVDEPEEVLAITFTRAATAEMLHRVVSCLTLAATEPEEANERALLTTARRALAHSEQRGWRILEQPHRLDIQTIDAVAMRFAHGQPLLARLGGRLDPVDDAREDYTQAAERTLGRLGDTTDAELHSALRHLLLLRDNNLSDARTLIADMLARRDQWAHAFPLPSTAELDWEQTRAQLEQPFRRIIQRALTHAHSVFSQHPVLVDELLWLARYASANGSGHVDLSLLAELRELPPPLVDAVEHWVSLGSLLLKSDHTWRGTYRKKEGFPADGTPAEKADGRAKQQRMEALAQRLQNDNEMGGALQAAHALPAARYDDTQWRTLQAVFRVMRHAAAELRVVFAERNHVDFVELGLAAEQVLQPDSERAANDAERRRHLLVDEFQDTSRRQHAFLSLLLREWQPGDGRTVFLVGDPMQSIYLFRQAEFELFHHVQQHGIPCGPHTHPCAPLTLSANFRSHSGLVDPLNAHFEGIFAADANDTASVTFAPSSATRGGQPAVHVHPLFDIGNDKQTTRAAQQSEAERVVEIIQAHLPRAEEARLAGVPEYRIAVLVRARTHLARIIPALRKAKIPYRAIDLEPLTDRQEILDLLSLTRALLLPSDRLAWLSVLRAPWCGLLLGDLHMLTGADAPEFKSTAIRTLMAERGPLLSEDGQRRLARTMQVLDRALGRRFVGNIAFAAWAEETWNELGGPACLEPAALENARIFFRLLDQLPQDGMEVLGSGFRSALAKLCAEPDLTASSTHGVQLLTMHKAKGLGFEVVIVPGLERAPGTDPQPLVNILERFSPSDPLEEEVLMAPLGGRGAGSNRTYKWIRDQHNARQLEERKRLLYVACTRAREELHLIGTATIGSNGTLKPGKPGSLLEAAWPAFAPVYTQQHEEEALAARQTSQPAIFDIAAAADQDLRPKLVLRRLPVDADLHIPLENVTTAVAGSQPRAAFLRPEGTRTARALGNTVHALLADLASALASDPSLVPSASTYQQLRRRATQLLREAGLAGAELEQHVRESVAAATATLADPAGRWTLLRHPMATSEQEWTLWTEGRPRSLRADRIFLAGGTPLSSGRSHLWIVDYKTTVAPDGEIDTYMARQREVYRPQLEAYAAAALSAYQMGAVELRYGLYFPLLRQLTYWGPDTTASV